MAKKERLDPDSRIMATQYIRRYRRYKAQLEAERYAILHKSPTPPDGQPRGTVPGNPTMAAAEALYKLSHTHAAIVVDAIEKSFAAVGEDILNPYARNALKTAIWESCLRNHTHSYESREDELPIGRRDFYKRKAKFLAEIVERIEVCTFGA